MKCWKEEKIEVLRDLAYSYIKKDIFEAHIRQDEFFYKLLKILMKSSVKHNRDRKLTYPKIYF
jgi:hypothetical protein